MHVVDVELYHLLNQMIPYSSAYVIKRPGLLDHTLVTCFMTYSSTVQSVYKNTQGPSDGGLCRQVVLIYKGVVVSLRLSVEQPTVVAVDRWSLYASVLRWVSLYSSYCLTTIAQTGRADTHLGSCYWSTTGSNGVCGPAEQNIPL